ncbi:MAG: hypothetical protein P1V13_17890 [Rhizobiaceae bacterium]|nr:hypothetical protein [Rhizobiaceae bacterium]
MIEAILPVVRLQLTGGRGQFLSVSLRCGLRRSIRCTESQSIDHKVEHASGMGSPFISGGDRQVGNGTQQIVGGNIAAHLSGGGGRFEKRSKRWFEMCPEIIGQRIEGRIAGMQRCGQQIFRRVDCE